MTELEVLYKLERAYSRKWWQFWIEPKIPQTDNFCYALIKACDDISKAENYVIYSMIFLSIGKPHKTIDEWEELEITGYWMPATKKCILQTIRSAIAKLKNENTTSNTT